MATIVQDYGPIYGEVVNGTVQGRPNGSVYVPLSNTISLSIQDLYIKLDTNIFVCNDQGNRKYTANVVAQSQDLASNIKIEVAEDSDFTSLVGGRSFNAGSFNQGSLSWIGVIYAGQTITSGETYYIRALLMNNGSAVATSEVITVTGWGSE